MMAKKIKIYCCFLVFIMFVGVSLLVAAIVYKNNLKKEIDQNKSVEQKKAESLSSKYTTDVEFYLGGYNYDYQLSFSHNKELNDGYLSKLPAMNVSGLITENYFTADMYQKNSSNDFVETSKFTGLDGLLYSKVSDYVIFNELKQVPSDSAGYQYCLLNSKAPINAENVKEIILEIVKQIRVNEEKKYGDSHKFTTEPNDYTYKVDLSKISSKNEIINGLLNSCENDTCDVIIKEDNGNLRTLEFKAESDSFTFSLALQENPVFEAPLTINSYIEENELK